MNESILIVDDEKEIADLPFATFAPYHWGMDRRDQTAIRCGEIKGT